MKTLKPLSLSVLHRVVEHGRKFHFTVSVIVFVDLDAPAMPLSEIELWKTVPIELGAAVLDEAMPKSRGEMLVTGSAFAPGGAPVIACDVRARLGAIDKTVRVIGDRAWDAYGTASAPTPFVSMPLRYTHAFGGAGYPLNPLGRGFDAARDAPSDGRALPNLEDPRWPLRSPDDTAAPAGLGALDITFAQRASKLGTYDDRWLREDMPGYARDIDWTVFNVAPEDQWIDGYFRGDEGFALDNLHPTRPRVEGRLPGLVARVFVNRRAPDGELFEEVHTRLDTVHFFPGALRAVMIHRGVVEVTEDDAADVLQLVLGCERQGEARSVEHYRSVLALRMDPERGALNSLRERDLMPDGLALSLEGLSDDPAPENLIAKRLRRNAELRLERAREALTQRGIDADQHLPRSLPEPEAPPPFDDLADAVDRAKSQMEAQMAEAARMKVEVEAKRAEAEARARATCAENGVDFDAVSPRPTAPRGGPPASLRAGLAPIRASVAEQKARGVDTSEAERALADPSLDARLAQAEAQQLDAYRKGAHMMPPAARRGPEDNARARHVVAERYRSGEGFARWDLTGVDLTGMHLPGADFRGALLECVDLRGANLDGADLTGATLARADLSNAMISGACFKESNLGDAKFAGARALEPTDFTRATLWRTDFAGAALTGAMFDDARLFEANLAGAELAGLSARRAMFFRVDAAGARLHGATLAAASFIECALAGADFTGAKMKSAAFVGARGDDAIFRGADLENLRAVSASTFARANFEQARMPNATLRGTLFPAARFTRCDLDGSDLSECDLTGADLTRASARDARFIRSDLTRATLVGAGLLGAIMQKATLTGADLTDAVLFGADLARTRGRPASLAGANLERARVLGGGP